MVDAVFDQIACVIFDMDGTLTVSNLDFDAIRNEAGLPEGQPILEYLQSAPEAERQRVNRVLLRHEDRAIRSCTLRPGAAAVLDALRQAGLKLALLTRNSRRSVDVLLERFPLRFDCCVTREDAPPKPSPEPIREIARRLGVKPRQVLVVGDYVFDVQAGRAAGARTAFLRTGNYRRLEPEPDAFLTELGELLNYLPLGESEVTRKP